MDQTAKQSAADQQPLWTQDEAIAFEVAREAINHVMSICTSEIADEERKPEPDTAIIARFETRLTSLHRERTALRLKDHAEIARIRKEYGAFVRAWNTRQDVLAAE
jgi:predicted transcriptional regulator